MELEKRKSNLIQWITQIENEQLLRSLEKLKKELEGESIPSEISELLELSNHSADEHLILHTKTKDIFGKK